MKDLLFSYQQTRKQLARLEKQAEERMMQGDEQAVTDRQLLAAMSRDTEWVIQWIKTGRQPGNRRGIERRAAYQRECPMDPIRMQAFVARSTAGSSVNLSESQQKQIEQALAGLSPRERECYLLAHGQAYSYQEIADLLQIKKGAVDSYIRRAQAKITANLKQGFPLVG